MSSEDHRINLVRPHRLRGALALALTTGLLLTGCTGGDPGTPNGTTTSASADGPRNLSQTDAERLGVLRFRNFDAGVRSIDVRIPASGTSPALRVVGWIDFVAHTGYASVSEGPDDLAVVTGYVAWTGDAIALQPAQVGTEPGEAPALPIEHNGWSAAPLDPEQSILTSTLSLLLSLGSDRPENSSLLLQSDAAWLRTETVDGTAVDVFAGPSGALPGETAADADEQFSDRLQYWLDSTGLALRVDLPAGETPTTVLLGDPADSAGNPEDLKELGELLERPDSDSTSQSGTTL